MKRIVSILSIGAAACLGLSTLVGAGGQDSNLQHWLRGWPGFAHNSQHAALSPVAAQPLNQIHWQTPVDLNPQYTGPYLLIHYGSPLITPRNNVLVTVKIGATSSRFARPRRS